MSVYIRDAKSNNIGKGSHMLPARSLLLGCASVLIVALEGVQGGEGFKDLTFTMTASVRKILPLEPLPIAYEVANKTDHAIESHVYLRLPDGFIRIYIGKEGEPSERIEPSGPWPYAGYVGPDERELKPGFSAKEVGYIYNCRGSGYERKGARYLFPEPGRYRLRAELESVDRKETVPSNVLEVEVLQPEGDDAGAYQFLRGLPVENYGNLLLQDMWTSVPKRAEDFLAKSEHILHMFPRSRYASYLRRTVGEAYVRGMGKGKEAGIALLEEAAKDPSELVAPEAFRALIRTTTASEDFGRAKSYLKPIEERYPGGNLAAWARTHIAAAEREKQRREAASQTP
jgi:hypothetical protein